MFSKKVNLSIKHLKYKHLTQIHKSWNGNWNVIGKQLNTQANMSTIIFIVLGLLVYALFYKFIHWFEKI